MPPEDRWLTGWLLVCAAAAAAAAAVNAAALRFTGICYFPRELAPLLCLALQFAYFFGPRLGWRPRDCAYYGLIMVASAALVSGAQFAPFPPIDATLARWDARLGYDTVAVLGRIARHPLLRGALEGLYDSTDLLLVLAPLPALIWDDREVLRVYMYAVLYSFLAGCAFYYFFPSSGPASVYLSPDFLNVQRATGMKFFQVHARQAVTTILGGMIAFPSFHVAWSVLLTYAAKPDRRLFILAAVWNALVIASTVLLGWHYLVDVPAGLALAGLALAAARVTQNKLRLLKSPIP